MRTTGAHLTSFQRAHTFGVIHGSAPFVAIRISVYGQTESTTSLLSMLGTAGQFQRSERLIINTRIIIIRF